MNMADFLGGLCLGLMIGMLCCLATAYAWRHTVELWGESLKHWRESDAESNRILAEVMRVRAEEGTAGT